MSRYPVIDISFYEWGAKIGMTDEEIAADWESYCDGLENFHNEVTAIMGDPVPVPSTCIGGSQ